MRHRDIKIDSIVMSERAKLEKRIGEMRDAIENPEKYVHRAVVTFEYTDFKSGKPFTVNLTENGKIFSAILDPEICANFDIVRNNMEYNITCIHMDDELYVFDYDAINKDELYNYANEHVFLLESEDTFKELPKIMFSVEGQVGNIERNKTEFFIYDFRKGLLISDCRIYFDNPKGYDINPGEFYNVEFLLHEHSLAVISMSKIDKPKNYKKLECFWDYREK